MGATGFVGSHVTRQLVRRGDDVRVYLRKSSSTVAIDDLDVERCYGDLHDEEALRAAMSDRDVVFYCVVDTGIHLTQIPPRCSKPTSNEPAAGARGSPRSADLIPVRLLQHHRHDRRSAEWDRNLVTRGRCRSTGHRRSGGAYIEASTPGRRHGAAGMARETRGSGPRVAHERVESVRSARLAAEPRTDGGDGRLREDSGVRQGRRLPRSSASKTRPRPSCSPADAWARR